MRPPWSHAMTSLGSDMQMHDSCRAHALQVRNSHTSGAQSADITNLNNVKTSGGPAAFGELPQESFRQE